MALEKRGAASSRPKGCHQTWLAGKNGKIMGKYEENQHNWRFIAGKIKELLMFQQAMFDDTAGNLIRHPEGPEVDRIWNFEHFPISVRFF